MATKKAKYTALEPLRINGARVEPGEGFDCPAAEAKKLISAGLAESPATTAAREKAEAEQEIADAQDVLDAAQARFDELTGKDGKGE